MAHKLKRPETLKFQALGQIRELLVTGQLKPDEVYSANHFAKVLGISRTPAREALLELTSDGYFISLLGRGFQIRQFSEKEVVDFFETRKLIENYVIGNIADLVSDEFVGTLNSSLDEMARQADDPVRFLEADKKFHMSFINLYSNQQFASIMENIRDLMTLIGKQALVHTGRAYEVIEEHRAIIKAVSDSDFPQAVKAMAAHIDSTEHKVLVDRIRH